MAVPDNTNNSIAVATTVVDTLTGAPVKAAQAAHPVNASNLSKGIRYSLSLIPGRNYTVVTSVVSLRDMGCAGTREHTSRCPVSVQAAALDALGRVSTSAGIASARSSHDEQWSGYWNASSVDLGGAQVNGSKSAATLEKWYYGMQYAFGSNVRNGEVTPSLFGILVVGDPTPWKDQLTLDYNLESNYWGAASSNRPHMIEPYVATVTNPGLLKAVRARATASGVWNSPPTTRWPGVVGSVSAEAACGGAADGTCHAVADMGHQGAYNGSSWPSTAFPLGDGRPAPTDLGTRFVGGLVATPLI